MVSTYEDIIDNETKSEEITTEETQYSIKRATSLTEIMFDDSNPGDLLVYRRFTDGHSADKYGEYALIPYQLINSRECLYYVDENSEDIIWDYAIPIGICIGDKKVLSLDEEIQPWAGDIYTGLYNTNYYGDKPDNIINGDSIDTTSTPWLSETNGYENTKKVLWLISENMYIKNHIVNIEMNSEAQANLLYNDIIEEMISLGNLENDAKNIFSVSENVFSVLDIRYKTFLYEFVDGKEQYDLSKEKLDEAFNKYVDDSEIIPNDEYNDDISILWKETTKNNNIYINQNNEAKSLTINYEYEKVNDKELGNIYVSSSLVYGDKLNKKNPIYSKSTNAFVYANQYNTVGTLKGDWYVGSKNEMQNLENYDTIQLLNKVISTISDELPLIETVENPNYLTSSQCWYNSNYCYSIYTYYRYITAISKSINCRVRLLLNIKGVPITTLKISSNDYYIGTQYKLNVIYKPLLQKSNTGVTWSITNGGEYCLINENTGVFTILESANMTPVTFRATSIYDESIYDEKEITLTHEKYVSSLGNLSNVEDVVDTAQNKDKILIKNKLSTIWTERDAPPIMNFSYTEDEINQMIENDTIDKNTLYFCIET